MRDSLRRPDREFGPAGLQCPWVCSRKRGNLGRRAECVKGSRLTIETSKCPTTQASVLLIDILRPARKDGRHGLSTERGKSRNSIFALWNCADMLNRPHNLLFIVIAAGWSAAVIPAD